MKSIFDLIGEGDEVFGPGMDLAISLVAVLTMLFTLQVKSDQEVLKNIKAHQMIVINGLADVYNSSPTMVNEQESKFSIPILTSEEKPQAIKIHNDATLQRISFGGEILFPINEYILDDDGEKVLTKVGQVLKKQMSLIKEIQIQGHADTIQGPTPRYNLDLAAKRAVSVFEYFRENLCIDPTQYVMSACSFGEYIPIGREHADTTWSAHRLEYKNKAQNRRIEVVLNYRKREE